MSANPKLLEFKSKITSIEDIYEFLNNLKNIKVWEHRASSTATFLANPLAYALSQLGISFTFNEDILFGTLVHEAVDFAYKNPNLPIRKAIKALILKAGEEYKYLSDESKLEFDNLIVEAIKAFKLYYRNVMPFNKLVCSEEYLELEIPAEYFSNSRNIGRIKFKGTLDRIYQKDGVLILSDLKTTRKKLSTGLKWSDELTNLYNEKKEAMNEVSKIDALIKKHINSESELVELENEHHKLVEEYNLAIQNKKAFKLISKKIEKIEKQITTCKENIANIEIWQETLKNLNLKISDLTKK